MAEAENTIDVCLTPDYFADINGNIVLYDGYCLIETQRDNYMCQCLIRYVWYPVAGPEIVIRPETFSPGLSNVMIEETGCYLNVSNLGLRAEIQGVQYNSGPNGVVLLANFVERIRVGYPTNITRVKFHIANFPNVLGELIKRGSVNLRGRIELSTRDWMILIDPVVDFQTNQNFYVELSRRRGNAITHVGELVRIDGGCICVEEADSVLLDIGRTLGFARAAYTYPILRCGYNVFDLCVWRCWTGFNVDACQDQKTWFPSRQPAILNSVFEGWRQVGRGDNSDVIRAAGELFINSHLGNLTVEARLVLAQAALEGLASDWPFSPLVSAPALSSNGFTVGEASTRIANIAVSLGIPLNVPPELPNLLRLNNPLPNSPALSKMTWVRNSIAHLQNYQRLSGCSWRAKTEAYELAAWHLELALLRILNATGSYQNRLRVRWAGQVEALPWV